MNQKSFYDLDYIVEINEKRLEQYTSAYQKVLERFTNLILIYSAITIFLIPVIKDIFLNGKVNWILLICFSVFLILFIVSLVYTIKLIFPVEIAYLEIPKKYYDEYRLTYEQTISDKEEIKKLLKASYITELEAALTNNERVFRQKSSFYYNALIFALLSALPYLVCLGFHISKKEESIQKIEIVETKKSSTFNMLKKINMAKDSSTTNSSTTTNTTQIPGINNSQVINSSPNMIKENSQTSSVKKK